eukprot:8125124-Pyramimonas_sp.AAC.1
MKRLGDRRAADRSRLNGPRGVINQRRGRHDSSLPSPPFFKKSSLTTHWRVDVAARRPSCAHPSHLVERLRRGDVQCLG